MLARAVHVVAMLVITAPLVATQVAAPKKPTAKERTPVAARIGDDLLAALSAMAQYRTQFLGLQHTIGDSTQLYVTSGRVRIGWNLANAKMTGGRYTPQESARNDTVTILCGDSDFGEIFECARVSLTTTSGQVVKPLTYRAGASPYTNAMGAKWRVREVMADYAIDRLLEGFSIDYTDFNGNEWTFPVSASEATNNLRLGLQPLK